MKRLLLAFVLAGCATAPSFPEPDASWTTASGQLQYVTSGQSFIGEFVASQRVDDFRLEFSKGGAVPLLRVARQGDLARAEGLLARGRWSGTVENAPALLRAWLVAVPLALESRGPRVELPGTQAGEKFVFIFNR